MRSIVRALALCGVMALTPQAVASGPEVSSLVLPGGTSYAAGDPVPVNGTADFFGAPGNTAPRTQVWTDAAATSGSDDPLMGEATPPYQDLVAGFIEETPTELKFTWQVADLPDPPLYVPAVSHYYWDFNVGGVTFKVEVDVNARGQGIGVLEWMCTRNQNLVECQPVPNAMVTVAVDGVANEITASVRRRDLRDPNSGLQVAIEGATLADATDGFLGIAAITDVVVLFSSVTADTAAMVRPYILGRHVEASLIQVFGPVPVDPVAQGAFDPPQAWAPAGGGSWTLQLPTFAPGDYVVAARACVGGSCGAPVLSGAITVTA